ncbi:hypothetical protein [Photorhabdus luminescens]|uniref:Uncharacterized protein n=1 Tax=Photorhabdus luminescens subsp. mexicana TaxID=2100167 RepID=A0A4R4IRB2_PHOLU|nr:hypothetical protein [Photorhabdus luminescens]TDB43194.1 hypothetical protein C5468_24135 [Photorhabdus luminescens subsp. mexicana]
MKDVIVFLNDKPARLIQLQDDKLSCIEVNEKGSNIQYPIQPFYIHHEEYYYVITDRSLSVEDVHIAISDLKPRRAEI